MRGAASKEVWRTAVRRLESRVEAAVSTVEKKVRDTVSLGRRPPPLEADNRDWEPLLYFEYDEDYRMTTHYSTPYLELTEEAHA